MEEVMDRHLMTGCRCRVIHNGPVAPMRQRSDGPAFPRSSIVDTVRSA